MLMTVTEFRDELQRLGAHPEWIMSEHPALVTLVWGGTAEQFDCSPDGVREAAIWYAEMERAVTGVMVH